MKTSLLALLAKLEEFGRSNDADDIERGRRMLNVTRDTGEFLAVLVRATRARRILEIGTSNGYSTLWLADAASSIDGHVTTVEHSPFKVALAAANFARSGLPDVITQHPAEAGGLLAGMADDSFDLVFLDAERSEYLGWWPELKRLLCRGGLLVVDNARSHAAELAPFVATVAADAEFTACTVAVGKGEFMATRARPTA